MEDLNYKWNLDDFKKVFSENSLKSVFAEVENNCVVVLVDNFEEMKALFGGGRSQWAIAYEKAHWNNYVLNEGRKQFVYLDFNKKATSSGSMFAFTYDPKMEKFTDAANTVNHDIKQCGSIDYCDKFTRYILMNILSIDIHEILKLETVGTKALEMKKEISELEDKYGVKLIIKKEEDC